jgi:hypothetical protein
LTCGEVPFKLMFANAAAGSVVQFFAIDLHSKTAHALSDVLNLMDYYTGVRNRHRALVVILNIARAPISYESRCSSCTSRSRVGRVGDVPESRNGTFPAEYEAGSVPWTCTFDIHQVCVMLQGAADPALTELREVLRSCPTADEALALDARHGRDRERA